MSLGKDFLVWSWDLSCCLTPVAALRLAPVDGGRITDVKGLDRDSIRLHRLRSLGAARGEELFDEANTASRNR
jgi:hypothetical protein